MYAHKLSIGFAFHLYEQLLKEMEKPLFEFKESQKKGRKEVIISYVRQCAHLECVQCCYHVVLVTVSTAPADNGTFQEAITNTGCYH